MINRSSSAEKPRSLTENSVENDKIFHVSKEAKILGVIATTAMVIGVGYGVENHTKKVNEELSSETGRSLEVNDNECVVINEGSNLRPEADARDLTYTDTLLSVKAEEDIELCDLDGVDVRKKRGTDPSQRFVGIPKETIGAYVDSSTFDEYGDFVWTLESDETAQIVNKSQLHNK